MPAANSGSPKGMHTADTAGLKTMHAPALPLRLLGASAVYVVLGWLALRLFSLDGVVGIFWPASGWALAMLLLGGRPYAWSVALGALLAVLLNRGPLSVALVVSLGASGSALFGHWLLTRKTVHFDPAFAHLRDYGMLILLAALLASSLSAIAGIGSAVLFGFLPAQDVVSRLLQWWAADALGIMLVTPLVLVLVRPATWQTVRQRWLELLAILALGTLIGQMVFLDGLPGLLPQLPRRGYWLFPLILWAAVRLGPLGVLPLLSITAVQTMLAVHENVGFFAMASGDVRLLDSWLFLSTLILAGMTLAVYFEARRRTDADLRIAASAFQCQEGMLITDADLRILRTNHSFSRIMGYSNEEVVGQKTTFMRSDRHPDSFYENAWRTAREQGMWADEVWHRRKNGEVFPQWLTATAVKDERGTITNFVVTHTDISYRKQKEAELQASQLAQRDALVREVHHRIKNNLQGISGLLRQFAQAYPEAAGPINQAIGQVRSIAVIHGLQGRESLRTVRLCELTGAIAADVASLWQTPLRVDIPPAWTPCVVAESEAVPLALVLNELMLNAVKHGNAQAGDVEVRLRKGAEPDNVHIRISNVGPWRSAASGTPASSRSGLQLVEAMLPRSGAEIRREQEGGWVHVHLLLAPPVIRLEMRTPAEETA